MRLCLCLLVLLLLALALLCFPCASRWAALLRLPFCFALPALAGRSAPRFFEVKGRDALRDERNAEAR